jgi:glucose-fructose oxidoreductase
VQTRKKPQGANVAADKLKPPFQNPIQYFVDCLRRDRPPEGPLSPEISRIGQQMVDSAVLSARRKQTVKLID